MYRYIRLIISEVGYEVRTKEIPHQNHYRGKDDPLDDMLYDNIKKPLCLCFDPFPQPLCEISQQSTMTDNTLTSFFKEQKHICHPFPEIDIVGIQPQGKIEKKREKDQGNSVAYMEYFKVQHQVYNDKITDDEIAHHPERKRITL